MAVNAPTKTIIEVHTTPKGVRSFALPWPLSPSNLKVRTQSRFPFQLVRTRGGWGQWITPTIIGRAMTFDRAWKRRSRVGDVVVNVTTGEVWS